MIQNMILKRPFIDCFYIQVENRGEFDVVFQVQMIYKGKQQILKSQKIKPYYKSRICVPMTASNVELTINIISGGFARPAYKSPIPDNNNHCYYITGLFDDPALMEMPC